MANINMVASLVQTITTHTGDITGVAFTEGKLATISGDKTVRLWNTDDYCELPCSPLLGHTYNIHFCSFSPLGTLLATCSTDGTVKIWDTKTGQLTWELQHASRCAIRVCKFSPDSTCIVTGSEDDTICLWEVATRKLIRSYAGLEDTVVALAYSPDGHFLVSGSPNGDLHVWDASFGHGKYLSLKIDAHDLGVTTCEFSPTFGTACKDNVSVAHLLLATGGKDHLIKLWTFQAQIGSVDVLLKCHAELPGHSDIVVSCAFSPSGDLLASGSFDKSVRLWDPLRGVSLFAIEDCHGRFVTCCAFSADGDYLATGSMDRTVKIWKLTDTSRIMEGLCGFEEPEAVERKDSPVDIHPMAGWSVEDVVQWLQRLGLPQYGQAFTTHAINGAELLQLASEDLKIIGVEALGHRKKMMRSRDARDLHVTASLQQPVQAQAGERVSWKFADHTTLVPQQPLAQQTSSVPASPSPGPSRPVPVRTPSPQWTVEEVAQWLDTLGLSQYTKMFQTHAIDGTELFSLTTTDLEQTLGIVAMGHRNKILRNRDQAKTEVTQENVKGQKPASSMKASVLENSHNEFLCPITMEIMRDPVIAADGYTYDRSAILAWFEKGKDRSPMTNVVLPNKSVTPNRTLKMVIQKYLEQGGR